MVAGELSLSVATERSPPDPNAGAISSTPTSATSLNMVTDVPNQGNVSVGTLQQDNLSNISVTKTEDFVSFSTGLGKWPLKLDEKTKEYWIAN